ncbi:MAG: hypothetical protein ACE5KH_05090 [Candidatus Geothermarchaeales archaeon]
MPLSIRCLDCGYLIFFSASIGNELSTLRNTFKKCPACHRTYDWDNPKFEIEVQ